MSVSKRENLDNFENITVSFCFVVCLPFAVPNKNGTQDSSQVSY